MNAICNWGNHNWLSNPSLFTVNLFLVFKAYAGPIYSSYASVLNRQRLRSGDQQQIGQINKLRCSVINILNLQQTPIVFKFMQLPLSRGKANSKILKLFSICYIATALYTICMSWHVQQEEFALLKIISSTVAEKDTFFSTLGDSESPRHRQRRIKPSLPSSRRFPIAETSPAKDRAFAPELSPIPNRRYIASEG